MNKYMDNEIKKRRYEGNRTNPPEITEGQNEVYYIVKMARLSTEEYRLRAGLWSSSIFSIISLCDERILEAIQDKPYVSLMARMMGAVILYCMIALNKNEKEQESTYKQLVKLNKKREEIDRCM